MVVVSFVSAIKGQDKDLRVVYDVTGPNEKLN